MKNRMFIETAIDWVGKIEKALGDEYFVECKLISSRHSTWRWHVYNREGLWFYTDPVKAILENGGKTKTRGKGWFIGWW